MVGALPTISVTDNRLENPAQPAPSYTSKEYTPPSDTSVIGVVAPLDQAYDSKPSGAVSVTVEPGQKPSALDSTVTSTTHGTSRTLWYWLMPGLSITVSKPLGHLTTA